MQNLNISNLKIIDIDKYINSLDNAIVEFFKNYDNNKTSKEYYFINNKFIPIFNLLKEYHKEYNNLKEKNIDELIYIKNSIIDKIIDIVYSDEIESSIKYIYDLKLYILNFLYNIKNNTTILINKFDKNMNLFVDMILLSNLKYKNFKIIVADINENYFDKNYNIVKKYNILVNNLCIIILLIIFNFNVYIYEDYNPLLIKNIFNDLIKNDINYLYLNEINNIEMNRLEFDMKNNIKLYIK